MGKWHLGTRMWNSQTRKPASIWGQRPRWSPQRHGCRQGSQASEPKTQSTWTWDSSQSCLRSGAPVWCPCGIAPATLSHRAADSGLHPGQSWWNRWGAGGRGMRKRWPPHFLKSVYRSICAPLHDVCCWCLCQGACVCIVHIYRIDINLSLYMWRDTVLFYIHTHTDTCMYACVLLCVYGSHWVCRYARFCVCAIVYISPCHSAMRWDVYVRLWLCECINYNTYVMTNVYGWHYTIYSGTLSYSHENMWWHKWHGFTDIYISRYIYHHVSIVYLSCMNVSLYAYVYGTDVFIMWMSPCVYSYALLSVTHIICVYITACVCTIEDVCVLSVGISWVSLCDMPAMSHVYIPL